jgi:hypothetical protein
MLGPAAGWSFPRLIALALTPVAGANSPLRYRMLVTIAHEASAVGNTLMEGEERTPRQMAPPPRHMPHAFPPAVVLRCHATVRWGRLSGSWTIPGVAPVRVPWQSPAKGIPHLRSGTPRREGKGIGNGMARATSFPARRNPCGPRRPLSLGPGFTGPREGRCVPPGFLGSASRESPSRVAHAAPKSFSTSIAEAVGLLP